MRQWKQCLKSFRINFRRCLFFSVVKEANEPPKPIAKSKCYLHRKHSLACSKNSENIALHKKLQLTTTRSFLSLLRFISPFLGHILVFPAMFFVSVRFLLVNSILKAYGMTEQYMWGRILWFYSYLPHSLVWYSFQVVFRLKWCG